MIQMDEVKRNKFCNISYITLIYFTYKNILKKYFFQKCKLITYFYWFKILNLSLMLILIITNNYKISFATRKNKKNIYGKYILKKLLLFKIIHQKSSSEYNSINTKSKNLLTRPILKLVYKNFITLFYNFTYCLPSIVIKFRIIKNNKNPCFLLEIILNKYNIKFTGVQQQILKSVYFNKQNYKTKNVAHFINYHLSKNFLQLESTDYITMHFYHSFLKFSLLLFSVIRFIIPKNSLYILKIESKKKYKTRDEKTSNFHFLYINTKSIKKQEVNYICKLLYIKIKNRSLFNDVFFYQDNRIENNQLLIIFSIDDIFTIYNVSKILSKNLNNIFQNVSDLIYDSKNLLYFNESTLIKNVFFIIIEIMIQRFISYKKIKVNQYTNLSISPFYFTLSTYLYKLNSCILKIINFCSLTII